MKEKQWRRGLVEKMENRPAPVVASPTPKVTGSDVYRDANAAIGNVFLMLFQFFGVKPPKGMRAAISAGKRAGVVRGTSRPAKKKGWF
jgi:hypothetical protein